MFDALKNYIVESESVKTDSGIVFFPVLPKEISRAELKIGRALPSQLKRFYLDVGYGFVSASSDNAITTTALNKILEPLEVSDLILGESILTPEGGFLEYEVPFFNVVEELYLTLRYDEFSDPKVYTMTNNVVSDSLEDFISELIANPDFYEETINPDL